MTDLPGPLLASGRDSDVFEFEHGRVLRRAKHRRSMAREARIMEYARSAGYPVPEVFELSDDGSDLVMERIDGPSMLKDLEAHPWRMRQHAALLASLHDQLHSIPAPEWLQDGPGSPGESLLHLDLHPLNVMLSKGGPMVIDWPNAARGQGGADVAVTWLLMA
ncbi:MAG TPA: phosphotransferase, partial [Acidimicrobiales bacterium]|nr:phosphotransferase [Acidimicrobiales bacterium]